MKDSLLNSQVTNNVQYQLDPSEEENCEAHMD